MVSRWGDAATFAYWGAEFPGAINVAVLASLPVSLWTRRKPTKRTFLQILIAPVIIGHLHADGWREADLFLTAAAQNRTTDRPERSTRSPMLWAIYLYRSLFRNPLRTVLTAAAIALPMAIFVLSTAVVAGLERCLDNAAKQLRLVVAHRSSLANPLPSGYRAKIESLDPTKTRLISVCGVRYIGGRVEPDLRPLPTLAADADNFVATFPEYQLSPEETNAWNRDRQAIVVGPGSGLLFGWKAGDRVTIQPSVPPFMPMHLHVVCRAKHSRDPITNWCRRDYFDAELAAYGDLGSFVNFFFVKCATEADVAYFRGAIDDLFASSLDPTRTLDDRSFINEFLTQQLDLPRNLSLLGVLAVFVALMAAANTLKMNFRERIPELATLKALGFSGGVLWRLTQLESVLISLAGGTVGALVPYIAFTHTPLASVPVPLIQQLQIQPSVCAEAIGVSVLVGMAAAQWAASPAVRMRASDGLRSLE